MANFILEFGVEESPNSEGLGAFGLNSTGDGQYSYYNSNWDKKKYDWPRIVDTPPLYTNQLVPYTSFIPEIYKVGISFILVSTGIRDIEDAWNSYTIVRDGTSYSKSIPSGYYTKDSLVDTLNASLDGLTLDGDTFNWYYDYISSTFVLTETPNDGNHHMYVTGPLWTRVLSPPYSLQPVSNITAVIPELAMQIILPHSRGTDQIYINKTSAENVAQLSRNVSARVINDIKYKNKLRINFLTDKNEPFIPAKGRISLYCEGLKPEF